MHIYVADPQSCIVVLYSVVLDFYAKGTAAIWLIRVSTVLRWITTARVQKCTIDFLKALLIDGCRPALIEIASSESLLVE